MRVGFLWEVVEFVPCEKVHKDSIFEVVFISEFVFIFEVIFIFDFSTELEEKQEETIIEVLEIVATNCVNCQLPKRQPTATPTACANSLPILEINYQNEFWLSILTSNLPN